MTVSVQAQPDLITPGLLEVFGGYYCYLIGLALWQPLLYMVKLCDTLLWTVVPDVVFQSYLRLTDMDGLLSWVTYAGELSRFSSRIRPGLDHKFGKIIH